MDNKIENKEGVLDYIQDRYQGLRGVFTGKGYGYFKFLSSLRNLVRRLKKLDEPNEDVIKNLKSLRDKIEQAQGLESLEDDKRDKLIYAIDRAINSFRDYSRYVTTIEKVATRALQGKKGSNQSSKTTTTTTTLPPTTTTTTTIQPVTTTTTTQIPSQRPSSSSLMPEDYRNRNKILENIENIKNLMK
jgi:hypothetical protein